MTTRDEAKWLVDKELLQRHWDTKGEELNEITAVKGLNVKLENYHRFKKERKGEEVIDEEEVIDLARTMYMRTMEALKEYIDLPEDYYHIIALWIIGTYAHSSFSTYPFIFLNAMKGSAKTRTLKVISHLSYGSEGKVQTGINETTLFRSTPGTTMVLDECEGIGGKEKATLREYLNASYKQGATVSRSRKVRDNEGETFKIEEFTPYRPLAIANIWGMEEVLGDRCITLILPKSSNPFFIKKIEDFEENPNFKAIKKNLRCIKCSLCSVCRKKDIVNTWNNYINARYNTTPTTSTTYTTLTTLTTLTNEKDMTKYYHMIDESGIDGRNLELFFPLLSLSLVISEEIFYKTLEIGKKMVKSKKIEDFTQDKDVSFIDFIAGRKESPYDYVSVGQLTREFRQFVGGVDEDERWLNTKWIGRSLKRLDLKLASRRLSQGVEVCLNISKARKQLEAFTYKDEKKN